MTDTDKRSQSGDRTSPLRELLDGILVFKKTPRLSAIRALPLADEVRPSQAEQVYRATAEYCVEIEIEVKAGQNSEARKLIEAAVDELSEFFDNEAEMDDPRELAGKVPRNGRVSRATKADAVQSDLADIRR